MNILKKILIIIIVFVIYTLPVLYAKDNIIDIGVLDKYIIKNLDTKMILSRNGSIPVSVNPGDIISLYGDYSLILKNKNKIITFTIKPNKNSFLNITIKDDISLYMAILFCLEDGQSSYTFKTDKNYKGNNNIKDKIKKFHKDIYDSYPLIDLYEYEYLIYSDKIQFNYVRRINHNKYDIATKQLKKKINNFILSLNLNQHEVELQKQIVSFILSNYEYDKREPNVPPDALSRTIQGVYFGNELVCSGYSKLAMYVLNNIGIETRYVVGTTTSGLSHAWNIVKLQNEYYHMDLTFSDSSIQGKNETYYQYINEKDIYMRNTHVWDESKYPKCVGNTYLNHTIYTLKKIDTSNVYTINDLTQPIIISSVDDVYAKQIIKNIANKLNKSIKYYAIKKYGFTIVLFI